MCKRLSAALFLVQIVISIGGSVTDEPTPELAGADQWKINDENSLPKEPENDDKDVIDTPADATEKFIPETSTNPPVVTSTASFALETTTAKTVSDTTSATAGLESTASSSGSSSTAGSESTTSSSGSSSSSTASSGSDATTPSSPGISDKTVLNHLEVHDGNGSLCFMADFELDFVVYYNTTEKSVVKKKIPLPKIEKTPKTVNGCSVMSILTVSFNWTMNEHEWNMSLTFTSNNQTYNLTGVTAYFFNDPHIFTNNTRNETGYLKFSNESMFGIPAHIGHAYECISEEFIIVEPYKFVLDVSHLTVQAFSFPNNTKRYSKKVDICLQDEPESKLVPIIVGCVLAGLIALVLVAYVIASKRYKKYKGYETL